MKKTLSALLCVFLLAGSARAAQQAPSAALPGLSAKSVLLMEKQTGQVLYEDNADEALEPASVTKVMTLLLIFEALAEGRAALTDTVTVSAAAAGMGGSQVYLKENEQMTLDEMLKAICVASGNDACVAVAEHLYGSEAAFVSRMNERAAQLGMTNTVFLNCTGLPAEGHVTSARDIALMSRELILNHPQVRGYTTIWMDSLRGGAFTLANTNKLIRFYSGATGLKTGSTDAALYCLSATAERDGMELIAVVLGSPTSAERFETAKALLDYGFANYTLYEVFPGEPLLPIPVILGEAETVQPVPGKGCQVLLEKSLLPTLTTQCALAEDLEAPVYAGQTVGELLLLSDNKVLASVPIVAQNEVKRLTIPGVFRRFLDRLFLC